jgi:DNA-binding CsgD family transcriptional regulator
VRSQPDKRGRPRHPDVLTPAEWQVVDAVRHAMPNWLIARRRGVSRDAVKFHVANALAKLGLESRAELRHWPGVPADSRLRRPSGEGESKVETELRLSAIGQIARQVSDIPRAVDWYGGVLGRTCTPSAIWHFSTAPAPGCSSAFRRTATSWPTSRCSTSGCPTSTPPTSN